MKIEVNAGRDQAASCPTSETISGQPRRHTPGTVYISAGRSEARRASTSSTLRPTPNPAPIPLRIPLIYPAPLSVPLISSRLAPHCLFSTLFLKLPIYALFSLLSHSYLSFLSYYPSHITHTSHHFTFQTPSLYDITNNITICYILLGTLLVHFSQIYPLPLSNAHSTLFHPLSKNLPNYAPSTPSKLSRYKISYPYHPPPEK